MLRAIRMIQEKTSAPVGDDVTDKQRIKEVADAATGMQRTLQYFLKSMVDHAHNSAAIHEDLANLYPAHQALSNGVATLNKESGIFASAPTIIVRMREVLDKPLVTILARTKELMAAADERGICRAEIAHYTDKVAKLANEGMRGDAKKQEKAESNQAKLLSNQKRFQELDAFLKNAFTTIDDDIAVALNNSIGGFMQLQAAFAADVLACYRAALGATPASFLGGGAGAGAGAGTGFTPSPAASARPAVEAEPEVEAVPSSGLSDFLGGGAAAAPAAPEAAPAAKNPFDM